MSKTRRLDHIFRSSITSRRTFLKMGGGAALAATGLASAVRADASRPIVYAYANWSDALAITYVGAKLIEDHFGYKVQPLQRSLRLSTFRFSPEKRMSILPLTCRDWALSKAIIVAARRTT
jgi:hypothetical protein